MHLKTWQWIAIGGGVLVVGYFLLRSNTATAATVVGAKVGTSASYAGAPPLPNLTFSNPTTAKLFTFPYQVIGRMSL